ncbi:MAG: mycothione reductase [Nocardioides sp.]|nr:mycothione reductase [Nocardioides sp.]
MPHYDLVLIGTGSGNTILDERFDDLSIAVIERGAFGGTCLNRGCIPSKMFVHPAEVADAAAGGPRLGVRTSYDGADWPAIRDRVFAKINPLARGGKAYREEASHITVHTGTCRFTGDRTLVVDLEAGGSVEVTGDRVVIATGGRPVVPDIPGLDQVTVHTSDDVMHLESLPRRLGVVGGGYVGSELAHVFASYGSEVVQVDGSSVLLTTLDEDVSRLFTDAVRTQWDVRLEAELERVEPGPDGAMTLHLSDGSQAEVDVLLVAVGRRPNSDLLDLDTAGVQVDDKGLIMVDEHQRTTAQGVFALGDASSPEPLKHVANQDARVVQHNLLNPDDLVVSDHRFVPQAVFASPQVASVGLTEAEAREQGIDVAVATREYADTAHGWALVQEETGHFVKLLADRGTGRLVGAHLIGPQASVLVQPLIQAMSFDQPVVGLARGQYWIHPALTEVVENALVDLEAELGA